MGSSPAWFLNCPKWGAYFSLKLCFGGFSEDLLKFEEAEALLAVPATTAIAAAEPFRKNDLRCILVILGCSKINYLLGSRKVP
jgi:hypothetical protein